MNTTGMKSNYERMRENARKDFYDHVMPDIAAREDLEQDETCLYLDFLGICHRIRKEDGRVERLKESAPPKEGRTMPNRTSSNRSNENWTAADVNTAMTIYDALSKPVFPQTAGEWVNLRSLSSLAGGFATDENSFFRSYLSRLDHRGTEIAKACEQLGGIKEGKGDISRSLPLLCGQRILLSLWFSDEDFGPSLQIYFDRTIRELLHYETLWYAAECALRVIDQTISLCPGLPSSAPSQPVFRSS